jgi:hypothetical protein
MRSALAQDRQGYTQHSRHRVVGPSEACLRGEDQDGKILRLIRPAL